MRHFLTLLLLSMLVLLPQAAFGSSGQVPVLGTLAYIQGGDVWVKELPDGEPKRLTTDGRNRSPRWSPSGDWLAFYKGNSPSAVSREGDQVWVIRKSGISAQAFPNCSLDWSPASDTLLCTLTDGRPSAVAVDAANQGELPPARRGRTFQKYHRVEP